jgi:hypothetical protein
MSVNSYWDLDQCKWALVVARSTEDSPAEVNAGDAPQIPKPAEPVGLNADGRV